MPEDDGRIPDFFTQLSIAMCPQDDGTRPVNPAWIGSDISFLSPAINFSQFPVPIGQKTEVAIQVNNYGTMDVTGAWMETAYNIYLGNQPQAMNGIQNIALPLIPALGGSCIAKVDWIPQDTSAIHACFFARVFDPYSMLHNPLRCSSWDPYINPQAATHNTIIVKIETANSPMVVTFPAKNFGQSEIKPKILVTEINHHLRFREIEERYPMPFKPEFTVDFNKAHNTGADISALAIRYTLENRLFTNIATNGLWPRPDIHPKLIHNRFGFDIDNELNERLFPRRGYGTLESPVRHVNMNSFSQIRLQPNQEQIIKLIIPPEQFPPRGGSRKYQVDYQVDGERPMQQIIELMYE